MKNQRVSSTAARLRQVRKQMEITQTALAGRLGMTVRAYSRYEAGEREPPMSALAALTCLGVSGDWLLTGEGEMLREGAAGGASADIDRQLSVIEVKLDRLGGPVSAEYLAENADLRDIHHQLVEIAGDPSLTGDLKARADRMLDLGFASAEAADRREARAATGGAELRERMRTATETYSRLTRELGWAPPSLTGMAVRDAMVVDGLSEDMARSILAALHHDLQREE